MLRKADSELNRMTMAIFLLIISLFAIVIVLRVINPFHNPEVKALLFSDSIASLANSLSQAEEGAAEIQFKDAYDVKVDFKEGVYLVSVKHKKIKEAKESQIVLYPPSLQGDLLQDLKNVEKVCIRKERGKAFAEVEQC